MKKSDKVTEALDTLERMALAERKPLEGRADTDNKKREICDQLYATWICYPELRLGQLLSSLIGSVDIFYIEDGDLSSKMCRCEIVHEDMPCLCGPHGKPGAIPCPRHPER
jgi:hypothetical protein